MKVATVFERTRINGMQLENRFVRSATWMGMGGQDGTCSPRLIEVTAELARGGVGLIITGHAHVLKEGQTRATQIACHEERHRPGLAAMAAAVHAAGGKVALQIAHAGLAANPELIGGEPVGPSPFQTEKGPVGREMTESDVRRVADAFANAASTAKDLGFDCVQIHSSHGFLLSQFLSPFYNKRTDSYGGSLENRARMLMLVFERVRAAVGGRYPVLVKLNSEDLLDDGFTIAEMVRVSGMLEKAGVDAIELSGGTVTKHTFAPLGNREQYWRAAAEQYKQSVRTPLILVGGIRSLEVAEELVSRGVADYVSMCRPFVREPDLINRWKSGDRTRAQCVSDNLCGYAAIEGKTVHCVHLNS